MGSEISKLSAKEITKPKEVTESKKPSGFSAWVRDLFHSTLAAGMITSATAGCDDTKTVPINEKTQRDFENARLKVKPAASGEGFECRVPDEDIVKVQVTTNGAVWEDAEYDPESQTFSCPYPEFNARLWDTNGGYTEVSSMNESDPGSLACEEK